MIWLLRLQRFSYALLFTGAVYMAGLFAQDENYIEPPRAVYFAILAFIFFVVACLIELRLKFGSAKALHTNRHAFKSVRRITRRFSPGVKKFMASHFGPLIDLTKGTAYGLGGSAGFANVFHHWAHRFDPSRGDVFLGRSPWDHETTVGHFDDKAMITFSEPRNGKGTSAIIPNLLLYPGSALCIDPKGENADVTGQRRTAYGPVHIVDPFGVSKRLEALRKPAARLNPLAELDPDSDTIVDDIRLLTDGIVIRSGDPKADHFDEGASDLIAAGIGHLITRRNNPNLADLRDFIGRIRADDPALLAEMHANTTCSGIISRAADTFSEHITEVRNFISSADKHTKWLDSPKMREALATSDFSLNDLKNKPGSSIFLVLEGDKLKTHARFLRLFVNLAIRAMRKGGKPELPVLFILDEFYALGRMEQLVKEANEIPGYGVKLWPIMHSIGQLKDLYGENWRAFLGGVQQYFGLQQDTADYVSAELGRRGFVRDSDSRDDRIYTELLSGQEIRALTSREKGYQIIIRSDYQPLLLERYPYYSDAFKAQWKFKEPDHSGHALPASDPSEWKQMQSGHYIKKRRQVPL